VLAALLMLSLAHAAPPDEAPARTEGADETSAPATPPVGDTVPAPAPAPAPPPAPPDATETGSSTAPAPAPATATPESVPTKRPTKGQKRAFRVGRAVANTGVVAMPLGFLAMASTVWGPPAPEQEVVFTGGLLAVAAAMPLTYAGVVTERSAIRRAGCTPRGEAFRHVPLMILGASALAATRDGEAIALGVGAGWGVLGVQHAFLQKDARECRLRRG
jgi:hypothetical protein